MKQRLRHASSPQRPTFSTITRAAALPGAFAACLLVAGATHAPAAGKPNIVFVILDDVGIDQLSTFGFGGNDPAAVPNLDRVAAGGVRFTNTWAMPECSPSRAAFFTGRYPLRTGVYSAIIENHLPQTYVSPFEWTIPRVLETAGYRSAIVGKYHLGSGKDPAGDCAPATRGWDFFSGNMDAGPPSVDRTAGGLDPGRGASCGFDSGDETGACYHPTSSFFRLRCRPVRRSAAAFFGSPARACLEKGGVFRPGLDCWRHTPKPSDFEVHNGYYAWPKSTTRKSLAPLAVDSCAGPKTTREFMTTVQTDDAIRWWHDQAGPRMLTVSYNAIHTPYQPPPWSMADQSRLAPIDQCDSSTAARPLANLMLEAMDREIGRLLAGIGKATLNADGSRIESLRLDDTVLVVVGDNGSFSASVKVASGFDAARSKGTVYETGVRVPMLVAGPVVRGPGRAVAHITNVVDIFGLFADIAGVDLEDVVPPAQPVDSRPLLPYLEEPGHRRIRRENFTQLAVGAFSPDPAARSWPCLLSNQTCSDTLFPTSSFCEDNGGTWYGPGGDLRLSSCCAVIASENGVGVAASVSQFAVRGPRFKLLETEKQDCTSPIDGAKEGRSEPFPWIEFHTKVTTELYDLAPDPEGNPAGIEKTVDNLLASCPANEDPTHCLTGAPRRAFKRLSAALQSLKNSARSQDECAAQGDGNLDLHVDQADIEGWKAFVGRGPSRYDIDMDGITNEMDLAVIERNLGMDCEARATSGRPGS